MDEMAMAVVGAAAAVAVMGKGLRPIAKLAMRGVVTVTDAASAGRRGLQDLHAEVRAEREQQPAPDRPAGGTPVADPASGATSVWQ